MSVEVATAIAVKFAASLCGAIVGLALLPPKTVAEFWTRAVLSVISGMSFSSLTFEALISNPWAKASATADNQWAAIVATAALSWWIMGFITRGLEKLDIPWPWVKK